MKGIYQFGPYRLDVAERCLFRNGQRKKMTSKRFELLLLLVRCRERIVPVPELIKAVWYELHKADNNNLNNGVFELRKILKDRRSHKYIKTFPRRGIRFVASVTEVGVPIAIAVLPFIPQKAQGIADQFLERGIDDAIITRLNKIKTITVRPQSATGKISIDPDRDSLAIGHQLVVDYVVDCDIRRVGKRIRVNAKIINVRKGESLRNELFDEDEIDIFKLEDRISEWVIRELGLRPTEEELERLTKYHTNIPEAYQKYKLARDLRNLFTEEGLNAALEQFKQAINIDPQYARAYNGVADCYLWLGVYNLRSPKEITIAKEWVSKALAMDDTMAGAHTVRANLLFFYDWDFAGAMTEFKRAIELNANYALAYPGYSLLLAAMKQFDGALEEFRLALMTDPQSGIITVARAFSLYLARQYDRSLEQLSKMIELNPNYNAAYYVLALVYIEKGMFEKAIESAQKGIALSHRNPLNLAVMAYGYARSGASKKGQQVLAELSTQQRYISPFHISLIHAALGEQDRAFERMKEACEIRDPWLVFWRVEPKLDSLRSIQPFKDLLQSVGPAPPDISE